MSAAILPSVRVWGANIGGGVAMTSPLGGNRSAAELRHLFSRAFGYATWSSDFG